VVRVLGNVVRTTLGFGRETGQNQRPDLAPAGSWCEWPKEPALLELRCGAKNVLGVCRVVYV